MRRSSLPLALFAGAALLGCPRRPPPPPPDACPTAPGVVLILEARPDASPEGRVSFSVTGVRKIAPHAIPETVTIEGREVTWLHGSSGSYTGALDAMPSDDACVRFGTMDQALAPVGRVGSLRARP